MDFPLRYDDVRLRPWRTAALAAAAIAAVELVLLVIVGGALIAKPSAAHPTAATRDHAATTTAKAPPAKARPAKARRQAPASAAQLTRHKVKVVVLNGNGRQGAAAAAATRVSQRGYRIGEVANAPRRDFTRSLVMYRRGFEGEGRRLARDLGIRIVGPLDGLRPAQLHGAQAVLVVGA